MEKRRETLKRFSLITGEDTYASETAQNPLTSRRLKSLIPSASGLLTRELVQPKYLNSSLPAGVMSLYEYDRNDGSGNVVREYFAATAVALYTQTAGAWVQVAAVGALAGVPMFVTINNLLHMADGTNSWLYDGTSWVVEGFVIPKAAPALDATAVGTLTITTNRYYWTTFADHSVNRIHESSSSPISAGTGAIATKKVRVYQRAGTATTTIGLAAVVGVGTDFSASDVGQKFYINGVDMGLILSVTDTLHLTLAVVAPSSQAAQHFVIAPSRATHWHIYASEAESSKVGLYLTAIAVTTMFYDDQSPFLGTNGALFTIVNRPVRNDPPVGSGILEVHKYRIFRRRDTKPNFFMFTANEEVASGANGSPQESNPGTDSATLSDIVNEYSYPKVSNRIRAMKSYGDGLYIGTEKEIVPLYGDSIDDFGLSQVVTFAMGVAGKFAIETTTFGMAWVSYDRKAFLYSTNSPYAFVPKDVQATNAATEIGKPIRNKLKAIKATDLDNVRVHPYFFGDKNWLVVAFQDNASVYHTWGYDFETKAWFEFSKGFSSLATFEVSPGNKVLVGGAPDGFVYVIDDQNGIYSTAGNLPAAIWRPALVDFGKPESDHTFTYLEYEVSNAALHNSITVNYYLDPIDVDNPGSPIKLIMGKVRGANRYRGFPKGGATCHRLLVEFLVASDVNTGSLRGVKLVADEVSGLIA